MKSWDRITLISSIWTYIFMFTRSNKFWYHILRSTLRIVISNSLSFSCTVSMRSSPLSSYFPLSFWTSLFSCCLCLYLSSFIHPQPIDSTLLFTTDNNKERGLPTLTLHKSKILRYLKIHNSEGCDTEFAKTIEKENFFLRKNNSAFTFLFSRELSEVITILQQDKLVFFLWENKIITG